MYITFDYIIRSNSNFSSGLLIEPGLDYPKLLNKKRKAYSINACLARKNHCEVVEFLSYKGIGGIKGIFVHKRI